MRAQGDHSELLVQLSSVYSRLRDPESSDTLPPLALRTGSVRGPASRALSYAGSDFESIASPSGYGPAGRTTKRSVRTCQLASGRRVLPASQPYYQAARPKYLPVSNEVLTLMTGLNVSS